MPQALTAATATARATVVADMAMATAAATVAADTAMVTATAVDRAMVGLPKGPTVLSAIT